MGNPKQKWTAEEEEALKAGIAKHGAGKWKLIQKDPEFNQHLHSRSNIDLKDKWRNMSAAVQGGSRDKLRTPKPKPIAPITPATATATATITPDANVVQNDVPTRTVTLISANLNVKDDSVTAKDLPDPKNAPRYTEMIFEALGAVKEQQGMDIGSLVAYIEQRMEVPQNFRKQLGARLRRLVQQDKLEKVDSLYRIKNNSVVTNSSNRKDSLAKQHFAAVYSKVGESLEEAAKTAAFKVVEAEEKSFAAADLVKEAEKLAKMAEETDSILQLAQEIFDRCTRGETILVA